MNIHEISTEALAYLGDSVMELYIREHLVRSGISSSGHLNTMALSYVTAPKQATAMARLLPLLTEEETAVFKRGRNSGHGHVPKAATVAEYRSATGMETLFGWLYLKQKQDRIFQLLEAAYFTEENETI